MPSTEILIGGLWAYFADTTEPMPESAELELLAPKWGHHRQVLVFYTKDITSSTALGAEVVVGPDGEGLGVLDLGGKRVEITVTDEGRDVQMQWDGTLSLPTKGCPTERLMDWIPNAKSLGAEGLIVQDPSLKGNNPVSCRCILPGGAIETVRLDHEYGIPSVIHLWEFQDGTTKAISDRALLTSTKSNEAIVSIDSETLVLSSLGGVTKIMISNDYREAQPHGRHTGVLKHLEMLQPLVAGGAVQAPTLQAITRSNFPTCPGAFFTKLSPHCS